MSKVVAIVFAFGFMTLAGVASAQFEVSGTILAARGAGVDSDVNDPDAPYSPNNIPAAS